jgi:hypothetical protein
MQNAGNATAAGIMGSNNAITNGINGAINQGTTGMYANQLFNNQNNNNAAANYYSSGYYDPGTYNPGAAANGLEWSDSRLKENIIYRNDENGFPVYEFNYKWNPKKFIGVMAQDILQVLPEAVRNINGWLVVNYDLLGIKFREAA